jgi:hypothetical protein
VKHRKPPKPSHYNTAQPGFCRYCGNGIFRPDGKLKVRANWHPSCLEEYKIIFWPGHTRKAVWKRDRGKCAGCNKTCNRYEEPWQADHIRPLFENASGDLSWWKLDNIQTLCDACHHSKSAEEARRRAEERRAGKRPPVRRKRKPKA